MTYDDWKTESPEDERIRLGNGEEAPEDDEQEEDFPDEDRDAALLDDIRQEAHGTCAVTPNPRPPADPPA